MPFGSQAAGAFLDANALKRDSSEESTPEEKSFFSQYHGSASSLWRKLFLSTHPRFIKSSEEPWGLGEVSPVSCLNTGEEGIACTNNNILARRSSLWRLVPNGSPGGRIRLVLLLCLLLLGINAGVLSFVVFAGWSPPLLVLLGLLLAMLCCLLLLARRLWRWRR